uniref:Uncharacterized protein n=1 Tax=Arundo donax TaxID=35708 RepID=A0A0A9BDT7_ARUDO
MTKDSYVGFTKVDEDGNLKN